MAELDLAGEHEFDRFGNRWQVNPGGPLYTFTGNNPANPQNNNRIDGLSYDASGNLLNDGVNTYTYDAESRITQVDGAENFVYDAEGRRVLNNIGSGEGGVLYDLDEHPCYLEISGGLNRGEIYAGGRHLATYSYNTTYFSHTDWLGTERARTTVTGSVSETCTSGPFGQQLTCTGTDTSPLHFTGKERDTESGNDYGLDTRCRRQSSGEGNSGV